MTDKELADKIRSVVDEFNELVVEATNRNIDVGIEFRKYLKSGEDTDVVNNILYDVSIFRKLQENL